VVHQVKSLHILDRTGFPTIRVCEPRGLVAVDLVILRLSELKHANVEISSQHYMPGHFNEVVGALTSLLDVGRTHAKRTPFCMDTTHYKFVRAIDI